MVTLTIDNQPITVPTGTTILDAARQADIRIPFRRIVLFIFQSIQPICV